VRTSFRNSTSVKLLWDSPTENNGVVLDYTVQYFCANTSRCSGKQHVTVGQSLLVTGLYPYTEYIFVVYARTVVGKGSNSEPLNTRTLEAGKKSFKC